MSQGMEITCEQYFMTAPCYLVQDLLRSNAAGAPFLVMGASVLVYLKIFSVQ
jgi:hypothetical protein